MTVIPFPSRPEPEALEFAIGARVDLRVGALAAGVVRPRGPGAFGFSALARSLRGARMAWRERGAYAPLVLALPHEFSERFEAELLSEAAMEAGCTRQKLSFELDERSVVADGRDLAEQLRARGWPVILRGAEDCPLPLNERVRTLFCELVLDAPETPDPFLALENGDRTLLGQRLIVARAAGMLITADSVRTAAQARMLAIAGFDRGGGPLAEAGLR
jgi:hypothetical protein